MADSENGGTSEQTSALERAGQVFAVFILVLLAAGIVFAVVGIYPHKIPTTKNPIIGTSSISPSSSARYPH